MQPSCHNANEISQALSSIPAVCGAEYSCDHIVLIPSEQRPEPLAQRCAAQDLSLCVEVSLPDLIIIWSGHIRCALQPQVQDELSGFRCEADRRNVLATGNVSLWHVSRPMRIDTNNTTVVCTYADRMNTPPVIYWDAVEIIQTDSDKLG